MTWAFERERRTDPLGQTVIGSVAFVLALAGTTVGALAVPDQGVPVLVLVGVACGVLGGHRAARSVAFLGGLLGTAIAALLLVGGWSGIAVDAVHVLAVVFPLGVYTAGFLPGVVVGSLTRFRG